MQCYFSKLRVRRYDTKSRMLFSYERIKLKINQSKVAFNGTKDTMLFSQERVRLRITKSKMALTFQGYSANFRRKGRTKNHPVKTIVKGQQRAQCYYPKKE